MKNKKGLSFKKKCKRKGNSVTFIYQGNKVPCPCTENIYMTYDRRWHINNPDEPDCRGTGSLEREERVDFKAFVVPPDKSFEMLNYEIAGIYSKDDLIIFIPYDVKCTDVTKVLYRDNEYTLNNVQSFVIKDLVICYKADLRLKVVSD